jgi:hypothetical protein
MQEQENAGFWWLIKTPAEPGERYWAGLAPHGASSLNEVPDHYCKGRTLAEAVVLCGLANKGIAIELADDLAYSRG